MGFLDDRYLLSNDTAMAIFQQIKDLPVVDPHNHADVRELAENQNYPDPWQLFAATDHYVWEVLRKRGVPESHITGGAPPREKWLKMAGVFPEIAGNPVYEWIHLDLRRLGIKTLLGPDTGETVWEEAVAALALEANRPQSLLRAMRVEIMCSTDDPIDRLEDHPRVNAAFRRPIIRPTWRPDKAMNIFSPSWPEYIEKVEQRFNRRLDSVGDLLAAMKISHDYFAEHGCLASDHGIEEIPWDPKADYAAADLVFRKARKEQPLAPAECRAFMSYFLGEVAEMDAGRNWVFQMHIGAVRDVRNSIFENLGPDAGGDVAHVHQDLLRPLCGFLNRFDDRLKVVLYCLEPAHQATLATVSRAFGANVNLGSAWWLNDTPVGMKRQLEYIGSVDLLANFAGMVSDSRKLLSYGSRFEMFRRVLADTLGQMVERGQIPTEVAEQLAERMAYSGPKQFFGL